MPARPTHPRSRHDKDSPDEGAKEARRPSSRAARHVDGAADPVRGPRAGDGDLRRLAVGTHDGPSEPPVIRPAGIGSGRQGHERAAARHRPHHCHQSRHRAEPGHDQPTTGIVVVRIDILGTGRRQRCDVYRDGVIRPVLLLPGGDGHRPHEHSVGGRALHRYAEHRPTPVLHDQTPGLAELAPECGRCRPAPWPRLVRDVGERRAQLVARHGADRGHEDAGARRGVRAGPRGSGPHGVQELRHCGSQRSQSCVRFVCGPPRTGLPGTNSNDRGGTACVPRRMGRRDRRHREGPRRRIGCQEQHASHPRP